MRLLRPPGGATALIYKLTRRFSYAKSCDVKMSTVSVQQCHFECWTFSVLFFFSEHACQKLLQIQIVGSGACFLYQRDAFVLQSK
jgi:hypothetical protein